MSRLTRTNIVFSVITAIAANVIPCSSAVTPGREYSFGFENGNLIRNWSFEQNQDNWFDESWPSGQVVNARLLAKSVSIAATSGTYVARFSGTNSTTEMQKAVFSDLFPIEQGAAYVLSMYVRTSANTANIIPIIQCFTNFGIDSLPSVKGVAYFQNTNSWVPYSLNFNAPLNSNYARVVLVQTLPNQGGTLYFDDVILEKGNVATARDRVLETVSFLDDRGTTLQIQRKIAGGGNSPGTRKYEIQPFSFDALRLPQRKYESYINIGDPDFDPNFHSKSTAYNNGGNGKGSLGSRPFQHIDYVPEPGVQIEKSFQKGDSWADKPLTSGSAYVNSTDPPANLEAPLPVVNGRYLYTWSKDVEGRYSLSWANDAGNLIKKSTNMYGIWNSHQYEYFKSGKLKKILTPYDDPTNTSSQRYRQVVNYNSLGEVTSTYSMDRGLKRFYRNQLGNLRYTQPDELKPTRVTYVDYDDQDRAISFGEQDIPTIYQLEILANQRSSNVGQKIEHKGIIYDNIDSFQARTGLSLSTILPGKTVGLNGDGRVVCEYALNNEVKNPAFDAARKFVATFYNYNAYGEVTEAYKYIGPIATVSQRIHRIVISYDENHRNKGESFYDNSASPVLLNQRNLTYDALGRLSKITGKGNKFICSYQYYDWGGLKSVLLGGNGIANKGTKVEYLYHAHSWIKEIKATDLSTGNLSFQQFLGYETKALEHAKVPSPIKTRYDGKISQQLIKYNITVPDPIRLTNYEYDDLGRMLTADYQVNTNQFALWGLQEIDANYLSWDNTYDKDSRVDFDDIGRITFNQSGTDYFNAGIYFYNEGSYAVDHVNGKLGQSTRDASQPGNFTYDSRGRLTEDHSKGLTVGYGYDDLPTDFTIRSASDGSQRTDYFFYDAKGSRVATSHVQFENFLNANSGVVFIGNQQTGEPTGMYQVGNTLSGEHARWSQMCQYGCNANSLTIYYIPDRGLTSTAEMGEPAFSVSAISRPNGPAIPITIVGVIKDSKEYTDLLKQYFTPAQNSIESNIGIAVSGEKRLRENFSEGSSTPSIQYTLGLFGTGSTSIGRITQAGAYEFYIKNSQGSMMRTVNEDGAYSTSSNWAFDYRAFGNPEIITAATDGVAEGYTGKEYDNELTRLTYFGARWMDPELGLFIGPDPAGQYLNPYSFAGGDPINKIDPDGKCDDPVQVCEDVDLPNGGKTKKCEMICQLDNIDVKAAGDEIKAKIEAALEKSRQIAEDAMHRADASYVHTSKPITSLATPLAYRYNPDLNYRHDKPNEWDYLAEIETQRWMVDNPEAVFLLQLEGAFWVYSTVAMLPAASAEALVLGSNLAAMQKVNAGRNLASMLEANAGKFLAKKELESGGHFVSRHGSGTTIEAQVERAVTGKTPDGILGRPVDATRFYSNMHELQALQRAETIHAQTGKLEFSFSMENLVGEGFKKGGGQWMETTNVRAAFDNNGLQTLYPLLRPIP